VAVGQEGVGDGIGVVGFEHRVAGKAFDVHGFPISR
jgi:hypothetical protein